MSSRLIRGAQYWTGGMEVDADGSPHAYRPGGGGLDVLANAGGPGNWYGLACDAQGAPFVQGPQDPAPGFYVSTTALQDRTKRVQDPRRYVDSERVPYVSVPRELVKTGGVHLGDLAVVFHRGIQCAAVVADVGPAGKYGEGSMALARKLGIPASPRNGGVPTGVTFLIFCGSSKGWPRNWAEVEAEAAALYAAWGDWTKEAP